MEKNVRQCICLFRASSSQNTLMSRYRAHRKMRTYFDAVCAGRRGNVCAGTQGRTHRHHAGVCVCVCVCFRTAPPAATLGMTPRADVRRLGRSALPRLLALTRTLTFRPRPLCDLSEKSAVGRQPHRESCFASLPLSLH